MNERSQVDIDEIQTAVENQLMSGPYKQLARAYIEYRHDRDIQREKRGRLNRKFVVWFSKPTPRAERKRQQRQQSDPDPA
ncbi:ATP cone domain-containing protein [Shigella flexneri]